MSEIIAYGYKRSRDDLRPLGADKVYIDRPRDRRANRDEMLRDVRPGDVVRVLYFSDLGGAVWKHWRGWIEGKGAKVEEHRPQRPRKRPGRPSRYPDPTALRAAWLRPGGLDARLAACAAVLEAETGKPVTLTRPDRGWLSSRYGTPGNPKPHKETW